MEALNGVVVQAGGVCRPMIADLYNFDEQDPDPHHSEKSDPNPH